LGVFRKLSGWTGASRVHRGERKWRFGIVGCRRDKQLRLSVPAADPPTGTRKPRTCASRTVRAQRKPPGRLRAFPGPPCGRLGYCVPRNQALYSLKLRKDPLWRLTTRTGLKKPGLFINCSRPRLFFDPQRNLPQSHVSHGYATPSADPLANQTPARSSGPFMNKPG
jgi:hypothetical protein